MNYARTHLPRTTNVKKALSVLFKSLTDRLDSPQAALTVGEAVPLFEAIIRLAGKLEETITAQGRRIAICEAVLSSSKGSTRPKIVKPREARPMTDEEAECVKYRVTFTVEVTNAKLLLEKAREMDAELTAIENELTAAARRTRGQKDYEPEGVETIEEALCWVLPGGDDDAECVDILDSDAVVIGEAN